MLLAVNLKKLKNVIVDNWSRITFHENNEKSQTEQEKNTQRLMFY